MQVGDTVEKWKPIPGFNGAYEVSNLGNVRSIDRIVQRKDGYLMRFKGKTLTPRANADGYLNLQLSDRDNPKTVRIHRLVAEAFIPNPDLLPEVNHKDEDKTNNAASNLEWCSHGYNSRYGTRGARISKKHSKPVEAYAPGESHASIRFDSISHAAEYFGVAGESVRQAIKYGWKCKGYTLKSACR